MIRPVTSADRAVLRELLAEFYDTDAVLHPLPASYHDAALDELFRSDSLQRACLLEQDGETAGYGLLSLKYSHEAGGLEMVRMREKEEAVLMQLGLPRTVSYTNDEV